MAGGVGTGNQAADNLARAFYVQQASTGRRTADRVQAWWAQVDAQDLTGSWRDGVGAGVVRTVTAGQLLAAGPADRYVRSAVAADSGESDVAGTVRPAAFAGRAADGRPLESLLYLPVITAKEQIAAGQAVEAALQVALRQLLEITVSEVADAGRGAVGSAMAGNRTIQGYVRVVNPPACSRCVLLAGKEYGWNSGFQRHPHCDCVHLPATLIAKGRGARRRGGYIDPHAYFNSLSRAEQDRIFTAASARAIREGGDIFAIVNARRGMYTADAYGRQVRATLEGTTRHGAFYRAERARAIERGMVPRSGRGFQLRTPRLLPEEIYRLAGSRDEAIAMLRRFGYLT